MTTDGTAFPIARDDDDAPPLLLPRELLRERSLLTDSPKGWKSAPPFAELLAQIREHKEGKTNDD